MNTINPTSAVPWSRALDVVLHGIRPHPEGDFDVSLSFGHMPACTYRASVDADEPGFYMVSFEEAMFFALSEFAVRRYANAALYQMELGAIIQAYARSDPTPQLPVRLGTSAFAEKPAILTLVHGHMKRLLYRWQLWEPEVWVHPDYRPGRSPASAGDGLMPGGDRGGPSARQPRGLAKCTRVVSSPA
jgi:hypothetical protein